MTWRKSIHPTWPSRWPAPLMNEVKVWEAILTAMHGQNQWVYYYSVFVLWWGLWKKWIVIKCTSNTSDPRSSMVNAR